VSAARTATQNTGQVPGRSGTERIKPSGSPYNSHILVTGLAAFGQCLVAGGFR
jgi:hypothetical protein